MLGFGNQSLQMNWAKLFFLIPLSLNFSNKKWFARKDTNSKIYFGYGLIDSKIGR